jgi:glutathione transport system permease protein
MVIPAPDRGGGWLARFLIFVAVGFVQKGLVALVWPSELRFTPGGARGATAAVFLAWWMVILVRRGDPGTLTAWVVWVPFMALVGFIFLVMPFTPRELSGYIFRRLLASIPVVIVSTFLVYGFVSASGDPLAELRLNPRISQETIRNKEHELLLDRPMVVRYSIWFTRFIRGDLGVDNSGVPVKPTIIRALGVTLQLVVLSTLLAAVVAIGIGVLSAVKQYSTFDYVATSFAFLAFAMPTFWLGLMLKQYLGIELPKVFHIRPFATIFEVTPNCSCAGWTELSDRLSHLALPVLVLSTVTIAQWSRFQRSSMLDVVGSDYVRTARAKGLSQAAVIYRHALRNALIPVVTIMSIDFAALLGGAVVTETVFGWKGMGQTLLGALDAQDVNIVAAWLAVTAIIVILFNLATDVLYGFLDPRIRYE